MTVRGPRSQTGHVTDAVLLDHLELRLPDDVRHRVQVHLDGCGTCRADGARLAQLLGDLRAESLEAPPAHLSAWARSIPELVAPRTRASWLKLVADSWADLADAISASLPSIQPTPMLRGVDIPHRAGRRRLLFAAGRFDLDLEIGYPAAAEARCVRGQLLPADQPRRLWTDSDVRLTRGAAVMAITRLDYRGEFIFAGVTAGRYRLAVDGPIPARTPTFEV